jgi:hypothetical protein
MTLAKLTITPRRPSKLEPFEVLFNPTSYSISKGVVWSPQGSASGELKSGRRTKRELNAPLLTFGGGDSRRLTLRLFFDVTETVKVKGRPVSDVRVLTNRFVELTRIERLGKVLRPPVCDLTWGDITPENSDFPFTGVVTSLDQEFVLFDGSGRPLRAFLTVGFTEFLEPKKDQRKTDPEFTTRVVKRGDTLSAVAADVYRDPARWRVIAEANNLDDPRSLEIGATLRIPKVV